MPRQERGQDIPWTSQGCRRARAAVEVIIAQEDGLLAEHLRNLARLCAKPLSRLGSPKADPESRTWVQVVYLGGDPRKQGKRVRKRDQEGRKANETCINE